MNAEIGIWGWLCGNGGDGANHMLLRQRIPEVCIFQGCELTAWYGTGQNGFVVSRKHEATIDKMLACFLQVDPQPAVAILRCGPLACSLGEADGAKETSPSRSPMAFLLSAKELTMLVDGLKRGVAAAEGIWSLQAFMQPDDDLRCMSVYSRDAKGIERSDVFGRYFSNYYQQAQTATLPEPSTVGTDGCVNLSPSRRAALEAKTLGVVRFASRIHGFSLEGLMLEFIFDRQGRPVLHGCWCASGLNKQTHGQYVMAADLAPAGFVYAEPDRADRRMYPVPVVERAAAATVEEKHVLSPGASCVTQPPSAAITKDRVLLEMWTGEEYLGEAWLPLPQEAVAEEMYSGSASWQALRLEGADGRAPTRWDARKCPAVPLVSVFAASEVVLGRDGHASLRFGPVRAEGLPLASHVRPRLLLWLRCNDEDATAGMQARSQRVEFKPIWASMEAPGAMLPSPSWEETVIVPLGRWNQSSPRVSPRPHHVKNHPESTTSTQVTSLDNSGSKFPSAFAATPFPGASVGTAASTRLEPQGKSKSRGQRPWPPDSLGTTVPSPSTHIAGAQMLAHWGMSKEDGSMMTHILAEQVLQRLSCPTRVDRSEMLIRLAEQLGSFHELQQSWVKELEGAKVKVADDKDKIACLNKDIVVSRGEKLKATEAHRARLAKIMQDMCVPIDEHRSREHEDSLKLEQSQIRLEAQHGIYHQLVNHSHSLQESLDKTVLKYDEIAEDREKAREDLLIAQEENWASGNEGSFSKGTATDVEAAQQRVEIMTKEVEHEKAQLIALRAHCSRLRGELSGERSHSLKLEDFVRAIASGPCSAQRTGGGFSLDTSAKYEAAALLRAAEAGLPLPPPPGQQGIGNGASNRECGDRSDQEVPVQASNAPRGTSEVSGVDEVHEDQFQQYAESAASKLAGDWGAGVMEGILNFMLEQGPPLPDRYAVKSNFPPFELFSRDGALEHVSIDMTITRRGQFFEVSYKIRVSRPQNTGRYHEAGVS